MAAPVEMKDESTELKVEAEKRQSIVENAAPPHTQRRPGNGCFATDPNLLDVGSFNNQAVVARRLEKMQIEKAKQLGMVLEILKKSDRGGHQSSNRISRRSSTGQPSSDAQAEEDRHSPAKTPGSRSGQRVEPKKPSRGARSRSATQTSADDWDHVDEEDDVVAVDDENQQLN